MTCRGYFLVLQRNHQNEKQNTYTNCSLISTANWHKSPLHCALNLVTKATATRYLNTSEVLWLNQHTGLWLNYTGKLVQWCKLCFHVTTFIPDICLKDLEKENSSCRLCIETMAEDAYCTLRTPYVSKCCTNPNKSLQIKNKLVFLHDDDFSPPEITTSRTPVICQSTEQRRDNAR